MSKTWIQSLGGRVLEPRALTADMVGDIEEIAHSLAGEFRFTRQTRARYTVAEHCVRGSRLLPAVFAGAFLLHELSEVYLPDVAGPLKPHVFVEVASLEPFRDFSTLIEAMGLQRRDDGSAVIPWAMLERQHTHVMLGALKLSSIEPLIYSPEVKAMDLAMLAAEKRDLCGPPLAEWGIENVEPARVSMKYPLPPEQAEAEFIARFRELFA